MKHVTVHHHRADRKPTQTLMSHHKVKESPCLERLMKLKFIPDLKSKTYDKRNWKTRLFSVSSQKVPNRYALIYLSDKE